MNRNFWTSDTSAYTIEYQAVNCIQMTGGCVAVHSKMHMLKSPIIMIAATYSPLNADCKQFSTRGTVIPLEVRDTTFKCFEKKKLVIGDK